MLESKSIMCQLPKVVAEHLFVQIPKQMEGLYADIGSFDSTLQETPEVFESIRVNLPVNVLSGMVNDSVRVVLCKSSIRWQSIGVEGAASNHVVADFLLQGFSAAVGNHKGADVPFALKDS